MFTLESTVLLQLYTNVCLYGKCCDAVIGYKCLHLEML